MGIPKFFRWMSERYPLCSQLITENRIPEFDNLYLDMNGIIHQCSHPNDVDAHFRRSEDKIFIDIFNYIDHLFTKIKPKKLFFMAVDGVAPRAKMNQQRSRRFRTAKEAADALKRAQDRGEELPEGEPFDSNCITPGTVFMAKLSRHLIYFINKKVSEDANWQNINIILSGHEVPGEGEHKIMEYIRTAKAQRDYDPNVRHCLYGLDADLIMLGLLSHDPHFALLREEVTFGPGRRKKVGRAESQNFYLMHLSLLREYLNIEFGSLHELLSFDYDLERIIDDFILLALFVGNDFIPHLPNLHIAEGALGLMFNVYKKVLPQAGGYINDGGVLNMTRLEMLFKELATFERDVFEGEYVDLKWFEGKQRKELAKIQEQADNAELVLTPRQKDIFNQVKDFVVSRPQQPLHFSPSFPARDRAFIQKLAKELGVRFSTEFHEADQEKHVYIEFDSDSECEEEDEVSESRAQTLARYEQAPVGDQSELVSIEEKERLQYNDKFEKWKRKYYREKMKLNYDNKDEMDAIVGSYLEGLQWVLHYYYSGVASWGWFYPYHYAPKIADLYDLDRFEIKFTRGEPFKPFEQLMGVLPEGSKKLLPETLQFFMTDASSPIIDFYPKDFDADLNGKKSDWEAVVKIPFIDEKRLTETIKSREHLLNEEERKRNSFSDSLLFTYDPNMKGLYPPPRPDFFPVTQRRCRMEKYQLPTLDGLKLIKGLCEGVQLGVKAMAGFPTLENIPHTGSLASHGVNVFNSESKNETIVITLENEFKERKTRDIAVEKLGKRIFVGWPFLQEGTVNAISDELCRYELFTPTNGEPQVVETPNEDLNSWKWKANRIEQDYSKRKGVIIGTVNVICHVSMLKGLKRLDTGALAKEFFAPKDGVEFAVQATVASVECEDARFAERPATSLAEEFPRNTNVFFLGARCYGCPAEVRYCSDDRLTITLLSMNAETRESTFGKQVSKEFQKRARYSPSYQVAKRLNMSSLTLSKLMASLHVVGKSHDHRMNLGLNLKFEAKKQKVLGYTRKSRDSWEYSEKAVALLEEYQKKFPEFIQGLENKHKDELYHATDFYPKDVAIAKLQEIKEWLKEIKVRDFERVPLDSEQLDKEAIQMIEKNADYIKANPLQYKQIVVFNVPRSALLKPSHAATRLQDQKFSLGDRVVFVQDSGRVPIAAKGTVVGIENNNIDVVCDDSIMCATTLGDRCSQYRGLTVSNSAILNLTNRQYLDSSRNDTRRNDGNGHLPHNNHQNHDRGRYAQTNGYSGYHQHSQPGPSGRAYGRGGASLNGNLRPVSIVQRPRGGNVTNASATYARVNANVPYVQAASTAQVQHATTHQMRSRPSSQHHKHINGGSTNHHRGGSHTSARGGGYVSRGGGGRGRGSGGYHGNGGHRGTRT